VFDDSLGVVIFYTKVYFSEGLRDAREASVKKGFYKKIKFFTVFSECEEVVNSDDENIVTQNEQCVSGQVKNMFFSKNQLDDFRGVINL
jgi:hypothetical protein